MLYLIGVGVDEFNSIGLGSLEILKHIDLVYIERFTGFLSEDFVNKINDYINNNSKSQKKVEIKIIKRWFIEDGREILENSLNQNICILIYGDPLLATTYNELLVRARKKSIEYKIIHSSSGISSLVGESGLHPYKFGKMVTMMSDPMSSITVYDTIYNNLCLGLHTLILAEYNNDDGKINFDSNNTNPFFLSPRRVIELLLEREDELKLLNLSKESFIIIASRIGQSNSKVISGKISSILDLNFESGPHSVMIPGSLHFTEVDAIKNLTVSIDEPIDNSISVERLSVKMLKKYIPNAKLALTNLIDLMDKEDGLLRNEYSTVIDNAENYLFDAEVFYKQGKFELAILSIGYAEGLIDSIRYQKGMNPW